jgi:hypothetical protein
MIDTIPKISVITPTWNRVNYLEEASITPFTNERHPR